MNENTERKCAYCGSTDASVAQHSGIDECRKCWNWRKLDGPAAKHWFKASTMCLSNVDAYDSMTFMPQRVGLTPTEFNQALDAAEMIHKATKQMLMEHGFEESTLKGVLRDAYSGMTAVTYYGRDDEGNRKEQES
jgi:hypothetical protein